MVASQTQFFPPCILVVTTAMVLAVVAYWSFYFVHGPSGGSFTPAPSTAMATTTTMAPATLSPPIMISLGVPRCPLALCEVSDEVSLTCNNGELAGSYCIIDELRPVCTIGLCTDDGHCESDPAFVRTTFQCDCTCAP